MNDKMNDILHNRATLPVVVGIVSAAIGGGVGFLIGRRVEASRYEVVVLDNEEGPTEAEEDRFKSGIELTIDQLNELKRGKKAEEFVAAHISETVVLDEEDDEVVIQRVFEAGDETEIIPRNIFAANDNDWNFEEELKHRSPDEPYILHQDEFYNDERGFVQSTFTYYAGDDVMCDEDDSPVYNHLEVVGPLRFGHGSKDPNTFHVRNEKRRSEYEVLFDSGHYAVEVMGLSMEAEANSRDLKHSNVQKFRMSD